METIFSNIKERILHYTDYKGFKKDKFFSDLGVTYGNFKGKAKEKSLSSDVLAKIVTSYPEINLEWLLTGKGEMISKKEDISMLKDDEIELKQPQIITVDSHNEDNIVLVPQKLKAGYLTGYNNPDFIQKLPTYRMPGINNGIFRMFEIEGNSMFPTLPNKSYVVGQFVENWETGIKDNKIYAIISNEIEDGIVKRCINRISKYNNLICKSDNRRNFPTQNITPSSIKEVWEIKLHLNFQLPDPADIYDRMDDLEAELQEMKRQIL